MHSITNNVKVVRAFARASVTATGASAITVDMLGYEEVMFIFMLETMAAADASNYLTVTIQESTLDSPATFTDIASNRYIGSLVLNSVADYSDTVKKLGAMAGTKRYLRLNFTETGTFSGTFSASAVLHGARSAPVS